MEEVAERLIRTGMLYSNSLQIETSLPGGRLIYSKLVTTHKSQKSMKKDLQGTSHPKVIKVVRIAGRQRLLGIAKLPTSQADSSKDEAFVASNNPHSRK